MKVHSFSYYLHRTSLCVAVSPPWWRTIWKNCTDYNFWSRDHKSGPIFMFDGILGSGRQNSIFRIIFVHFNIIFHSNLTNLALSGATQKLQKSLPCAENFFASLTDDIFIICNLKVSKNNRNTYRNMHFEKKIQKNVLGTYFMLCPLFCTVLNTILFILL